MGTSCLWLIWGPAAYNMGSSSSSVSASWRGQLPASQQQSQTVSTTLSRLNINKNITKRQMLGICVYQNILSWQIFYWCLWTIHCKTASFDSRETDPGLIDMNISLDVNFEFYFRDGSLDLAFLLSAAGFSGFYPGEEEGKKTYIKPAHQKEYFLNAQIQKIRSICQQNQRKSILLGIIKCKSKRSH